MTAKVIEISGLDGSGKSTAFKYFCDKLEAKGFRVLRTREVGSPLVPVCSDLRKVVLNPESKMDGKSMELVFAAMRIENQRHYESVKDQYDFIVSDRGWLCHLAYTDNNVNTNFTHSFYNNLMSSITTMPDQIIYLGIDPDVALQRREVRGEAKDAIESKGSRFLEAVAFSYEKHIAQPAIKGLVRRINANRTLEEVQEQLDAAIIDLKYRREI